MKCDKCNSFINENDKFCNNCGSAIGEVHISFDEVLIKTYIGSKSDKMYDKVKSGGIVIWSILFGLIYFMYRKMYLVTFFLIVLTFIVNVFLPSIGTVTANIVGLIFCPLYKWDITRKLKKIKENNKGASDEQLLEISKNQGGVSLVSAIATACLFLLIFFISYMIV